MYMEKLTVKQAKVLQELKKYLADKGYPPTVRELCKLTNLNSTATIHVHLDHLENKGYIKKAKDKNEQPGSCNRLSGYINKF